jgi:NTP pyrophosphatase (non-canonical NTP hydrolase)
VSRSTGGAALANIRPPAARDGTPKPDDGSALEDILDIRTAQEQAWKNKLNQGFNTTDVPLELCFLQGEVAEFFEAWRRRQADVGEELADVAIYVLGLAEMIGVDLANEVAQKISKNAARQYEERDGVRVKVTTDGSL